MMLRIPAILLIMMIGLGGCATGYNSALQKVLDSNAENRAQMRNGLEAYKTEAGCDGPSYRQVSFGADLLSIGFDGTNDLSLLEMSRSNRQSAASGLNRLGEAAAAKGCRDAARRAYLKVIETYTGSAFSSARQVAQIGIDDLRSAPPAPPAPAFRRRS